MTLRKLLARIEQNATNVAFNDFVRIVKGFGFVEDRVSGSHHIFKHAQVRELVNLQDYQGQAKPYQIRQFLKVVERYNLKLEKNA